MHAFLAMGGYGWFVWSAYAITALVMVGLAVLSVRQARRRTSELERLREGQREPASTAPVRARVARRAGDGPAA